MANINVKQRLDGIGTELRKIREHVEQYSGISKEEANRIDNEASAIAEEAARIAGTARLAMGNRSGIKLVKDVRRALGFTRP